MTCISELNNKNLCCFIVDIPIADYDDADDPTNGEIQAANQPSNKYRLAVEDMAALNAVKVATRQEDDVIVAQPVVVEADRSKVGAKRRSQMQVVSIRLDSDSDSSNGRKLICKAVFILLHSIVTFGYLVTAMCA